MGPGLSTLREGSDTAQAAVPGRARSSHEWLRQGPPRSGIRRAHTSRDSSTTRAVSAQARPSGLRVRERAGPPEHEGVPTQPPATGRRRRLAPPRGPQEAEQPKSSLISERESTEECPHGQPGRSSLATPNGSDRSEQQKRGCTQGRRPGGAANGSRRIRAKRSYASTNPSGVGPSGPGLSMLPESSHSA